MRLETGIHLPKGVRQMGKRYYAWISIYRHEKAKFMTQTLGGYETEAQAVEARLIVSKLIGTTPESKKKVRRWKIVETLNEYRKKHNLKPLRVNER